MMEEGGVTVCVRVRPLIARENEELDEKGQVSWKSEDCTVSQTDGTRSFVFDRVFHSNNSTKEVYEGVTAPIIKSAVQGYNGTIFAYGQTASGKTYTILGTKDGPGILTMAINDVFNTICRIPDREFLLRISYMEIHNETIQDLLCSNIRKKKSLVVREDINRTIYVEDLNEEVVVSPEEVMSWLKKGEKNRHYGETKMNERSSRSHTIFRMIIESKEKHTSGSSYEGAVMVSHLNFVDLAGSERASQTGAEGIRLKEGCNINRSLFILGQVIKKLCDDQSGGFINYRDSKLTRILQNSLGGNAKTVIICTITPASLEETLSTLQFASTAKKMKNTPKVNEVLDDDALLKRYRNEIEDLKRQLEEVSSYSQTKNQLAQLLEEKNSVQKEQQDRIRALTEMLVTSSSFLREQERKDKKKRRVTWAPGALSQDGGIPFLEDIPGRAKRFKSSLPCLTEMEESVSSDFSDYEDPSSIMPEEEWIPGSKINFTSKRESIQLCQSLLEERNNAVTEQQTIQAKFDSVCLEKERLTYELTELHEKISTHEFMALEKQASEEQEMQLMHEITNLKAIISNAEIYNQDLQQEINSKDMQCKEQEERITALEEHNKKLKSLVEEFRKDKNDTTILIQTPRKKRDEVQELKQSLRDAEAVALDAKKESAFLQSENVTLKEKMNQLSDTCNQIEKDLGSYKTQLETGKANYKKMQSDLQKELQYYMQENAKLTSLVDVNNSKGLLPYMELGGKMEDLKNQLNKALDENVDLKEKLAGLSEANSGSDLEILHKEIVEKNDTIALLMSEKEMLLSRVAEKERMLHEATQTLASKMDLTNDEVIRGHTVAFEELRQPCGKLEQKSLAVAEEHKSMKTQIDSCSNGSLNTSISYNTQEQSTKKEELEEKDMEQEELLTLKKQLDEAHEKLSEMEELKDQLKAWESKMEAEEAQKSDMMERLQEDEEKIRALTQERNDFKQKQEALEKERDQLKEEIQDIVSMFPEKKQSTKMEELEEKDVEQEELLTLKKQLDEAHEKLSEMEELKDQLKAWESKMEAEEAQKSDMMERLQEDKEKIRALTQERNDIKQKQEALEKERDQLKEDIQHIVSMQSTKKEELEEKDMEQEELLMLKKQLDEAHEKLSEMEELKDQLKAWESKMEAEEAQKSDMMERLQEDKEKIRALTQERNDFKQKQEALEKERDQLKEDIQDTVSMQSTKKEDFKEKDLEQEELLTLKKQLDEAHEKLSEMEELKGQLKAWESKMEAEEAQKSDMMERLQEDKEKIRALTQERNDIKQKQEALEKERDQLKEDIQDIVSMFPEKKQSTKKEELEEKDLEQEELLTLKKQLDEAHEKLSEMEELKDQLKAWESKMEAEEAQKSDMMERLQEDKEKIRALTQERNDIKQKQEALEKERDQLKEDIQHIVSMQSTKKEELEEKDMEQEELLMLKKQLDEAHEKLSEMEELKDQLKAWESKMEAEEAQKSDMMERLQEDKEKIRVLTQERNDFKQKQEALEKERDQLKEDIQDTVSMQSTKKEELEEKDLEQEELLTLKKQLDEAHEKLSEMEELKDQLKAWESKMEAEEAQKSDMMERLQEDKEKIRALTQERNDFKEKQEALEKERDQLKEDIQDTVLMNIEAQEGLMSAQNSLKQFQKLIEELKETIAEKDKQISRVKETLEITIDDQKQQILQILQILKLTDDLKDISVNQFQNEDVNNELQWIKEQIATLQQEKVALQHQLEDLEKEKTQYLESNQMLKTKSFDLQQLLQTNQNAENFDDAEQLKIRLESQVDVLQKENAELVQKLHSTEEDIKNIGQEKEHLRTKVEVLQAEKDTMTQTVYHLGETLEKLVPMNLELQEQLNEANNSLREPKEMVEELKGKTIAVDSQTSKIDEELKQKAEDPQLELERLLAYVKLQEDEVNTQKNLVLEKQQMFQRLEEEFKEETKKLKEKIQYLENNSLELRQLLCLKEEESQQTVEKTKDDKQLRSISESQMEALQREKTELVQTLQSSEENFKYISQEKENLRTEIEVLQTEKDNMIQTVHRLSETIERLVPVNLELQQELREANNSLKEHKEMVEELKEKIVTTDFQTLKIHEELKKKCEHSQLEMEKLLMYVKSHEDELNAQKNLVIEQQQMFQKLEEESKEETKHLKEKIIKSNEEVSSLTEEKKQLTAELREQEKCVQQLLKEKELLQKERDDLQQITENIKEETQSQLQETFSENAAKIIKLNKEASSLNEEKKQLTAELREQEKCVQQLLKENNLLQKERDDLQQVMENIREETQSQFQEILSENAAKIIKLNEEANSLTEEKKQLTAELREQEKCVQQLLKEKALLQKERDDLQQVTENIKEETQSQLQETFTQNAGKESEMSVQRKMQDCFESLEAKIFRIMEAQKKFLELEKRSEYFIKVSLQIKNQYDSKKALITKWLPDISRQEANNIKRLQIENERISNSLYSLLNKLQYFFACLCDKRKEYYTNVSQYTKELLDERRNQHALLMQMQQLGKPHLEQQGAVSQQFGVSELIQSLDSLTEQISKEVSEMEEELRSTEVMLQELERENVEMEQYLERCSDHFDLQGFKATIKQNIEKFRTINQFLQPKAEPYFQARSALEALNANYCREIDATLKACKEETKELILQLDVLKKGQKSCSVPNMAVKEEKEDLGCKLKATEQDTKNLQLKIQDLESIINEGRKNLQEKEKIITILEMKLKVKASRSEVIKLQAALEEKENCLRNALSERETLKAQVDKGVGLYKEKIEDLTTQLAKADMARMKQSKLFDREMANAKALADHREEQLRKLKEELRKAQQEQDITVMSNKDLPQSFLPITCGGGSGIVQNTHMLVLKSEHAKLEKEYAQLKKEHDLLLTNEHLLKEEIKKWKERAMKRRERALGDTTEEHKLKSPRKPPASSLLALPASPCKESSMQPILPLDTPQLMPSNRRQSNFFDNSCLGITANAKFGKTESEENNFKDWLSSEDRGDVSNCKTQ